MSVPTLDLHGYTLKRAQIILPHYLSRKPSVALRAVLPRSPNPDLLSSNLSRVVITGTGKHSSSTGGPVLRLYVQRYLDSRGKCKRACDLRGEASKEHTKLLSI